MPYESLDDLVPPPAPASPSPSPPASASEEGERAPSTWELNLLTVGILGAQLAWTVEMAYGTPYLLGLGLSKQATSLVWMAGPLSGLVVQPVVGALSDQAYGSRFRRRFYILWSAALIVLSTLVVAYARPLAALASALAPGLGDWDPDSVATERAVAIALGVVGFYVLDFSLNGLQASLRALVLDRSPGHLQSVSNAWLGRHTHLGNLVGYLLGHLDLANSTFLAFLAGNEAQQFRKLAVVSLVVMLATVGVTCATQHEAPAAADSAAAPATPRVSVWRRVWQVAADVKDNFHQLPIPVRRVCYVQFFAWTAWFPFLFYSTTYVAEQLYASLPTGAPLPSADDATRSGSFALLLYSLVSLAAGSLIPFLTSLATTYRSLPARVGPVGRWILSRTTPRNCWTVGLGWYAACMLLTFWARGLRGATAVVALAGVPWAITCWVPFALVMESIRELEAAAPPTPAESPSTAAREPAAAEDRTAATSVRDYGSVSSSPRLLKGRRGGAPFRVTTLRNASGAYQSFTAAVGQSPSLHTVAASEPEWPFPPAVLPDERTRLVSSSPPPTPSSSGAPNREQKQPTVGGGTILGLHNMAVVLPQFFVALVAAAIFKLTAASPSPTRYLLFKGGGGGGDTFSPSPGDDSNGLRGSNDVVWVLRFGGLAALIGMVVSRWVCETKSEREYREYINCGWRESILDGGADQDGSDC
ncbi:hypothetical protein JCM3774_005187 [Rhodotorula dairenensis]